MIWIAVSGSNHVVDAWDAQDNQRSRVRRSMGLEVGELESGGFDAAYVVGMRVVCDPADGRLYRFARPCTCCSGKGWT